MRQPLESRTENYKQCQIECNRGKVRTEPGTKIPADWWIFLEGTFIPRTTAIPLKCLKREGSDRIKRSTTHLVHCSGGGGVEAWAPSSGQVTAGIPVETPGAHTGAAGALGGRADENGFWGWMSWREGLMTK